jgi:hypothetical protein
MPLIVTRTRSLLVLASAFVIVLGVVGGASATKFTFTPSPADLYELDHWYAYEWGIQWSQPTGERIVSASLFFDGIRNWTVNDPNDLYVDLLNSTRLGIRSFYDAQGGGDYFSGNGVLLNHWKNLPATAHDVSYAFDNSELNMLGSYLVDGRFGFGFDPDCHYYNKCVKLTVETAPVPEPATMLLFGAGLLGIAGLGRRKPFRK